MCVCFFKVDFKKRVNIHNSYKVQSTIFTHPYPQEIGLFLTYYYLASTTCYLPKKVNFRVWVKHSQHLPSGRLKILIIM